MDHNVTSTGATLSQLYASRALSFADFATASPAMREALERASTAAAYDVEVLLVGETGTGKNLIAFAMHNASERRDGPFIWMNAAAVPEHLVESELFGHERGAFTSAVSERRGLLELAHGGTLFLDEIGSASPSVQAKLLTALEHGTFYRVGGSAEVSVDARVISATNVDLRAAMEKGEFRKDLYYRFARVVVRVPSLRDRREDVLPMAQRFLEEDALRFTRAVQGFSPECEARLLAYSWPGNVRELRGLVSNAVCMSKGPVLGVADVFGEGTPLLVGRPSGDRDPAPAREVSTDDVCLPLHEVERRHIERVLRHCAGNVRRAAEILQVSRQGLYGRLKAHGIDPRADSSPPES